MGCGNLVGGSPTRAMVGWPGSWQAVWLSNWPGRSPATKAAFGGRANRRAVTCVKPEQASKGKVVDVDPAEEGGRQHGLGKQPTDAPRAVHRGKGHGTSRQGIAQTGEARVG